MDKSLDDIVAANRTSRGGRRTSARRNPRAQIVGTTTVPSPVARARVAAAKPVPVVAPSPAATQPAADKIIVSNLPPDVNEAQVKDLFHSTVGPLRDVTLHYDAAGRSKGVASVLFQKRGDGTKAYQTYNNRLIDGKRPMKIEVVVDPSRLPPAPSLVSRVAPAPKAAVPAVAAPNRRPGGGRGRRGSGRGGGRPKSERTPKTVADLDAEMEDYTASNGPAAPAAAAV